MADVTAERRHGERDWPTARTWASYGLIALMGLYVIVPMLASLAFSIYVPTSGFTAQAYIDSLQDPRFFGALSLTLALTALTVVGILGLMVPTMIYLHLRAPQWRSLMEILCIIPLVVPSIALAAGLVAVLRYMAGAGAGSSAAEVSQVLQNPDLPVVLVGSYMVLSLPFVFRSLDAGLRVMDLKTLVESARSLGASGVAVIFRVVLPNIKAPLAFCTFFTIALCLGEFTMAVTLGYRSLPVWLTQVAGANFRASISMALLINVVTWLLLITMTLLAGRTNGSRTSGRSTQRESSGDAKPSVL